MNQLNDAQASILLVDDQPEGLMALEATLAPLNQPLVRAKSGREALRYLLHQDFAVVLLDVVMPDLDGFETAQLIRDRTRSSKTPIIFLTALAHGEVPHFKAYSVGAVDYLVKPFEPEILRSKVSVFVDLALKGELVRQQAEQLRRSERREHERQLAEANQRVEAERVHAREELLRRELRSGRNQQAWLESVLDAMPTPLMLVEPKTGKTVFGNRTAIALAGGAFVEPEAKSEAGARLMGLDGKPLSGEDRPAARAARGERLNGLQVEWLGAHTSGSALVFSESLPASFGHPETALLALLDVSHLKAVERDLQRAVRQRDDFLSVASHELKTPLTSLKMNIQGTLYGIENAAGGSLGEEAVLERLRRLDRNVGRIGSLVDNLLDISRINAGRLELELDEVDLSEVVHEVTARFQEDLTRAGCELQLKVHGPVLGVWDKGRLDQVVTNLLSNALKYAAGQPVRIAVSSKGERATLEVADQGPGIAPEDQARIFGRFERAARPTGVSGFGLGLWIVQQIVHALGGTVEVRSEPGAGATFSVGLPRGQVACSTVAASPARAQEEAKAVA